MPKKKHPHRHKGRTSRGRTGGGSRRARTDPEAIPDLVIQVRRALYDEHPLALLDFVSTLLATVDPRRRNPFDSVEAEDLEPVTREELIESFLQSPLPETSALLAVIAEMDGDELMRARIRKELAAREHVRPAWLTNLRDVVVYRAVEMTHILGDGDDVLLGARIDGHELTCGLHRSQPWLAGEGCIRRAGVDRSRRRREPNRGGRRPRYLVDRARAGRRSSASR